MSADLTQAELLSQVSDSERGISASAAVEDTIIPLSFSQERLWFLQNLEPDSPAYHVPLGMRLRGRLNLLALQRSLERIVGRHEILRTRYRSEKGWVRQIVYDEAQVPLPMVDLMTESFGAREGILRKALASAVRAPFDLCRDLPLRAQMWRLREDEHVLLLVLHHIAADEWSLINLLRELEVCYSAYASGREPALDELPLQYADFAVWQREWLGGQTLEELQRFWLERVSRDLAPLDIPADGKVAVEGAAPAAADRIEVVIPPELERALNQLSERENVTLFMLCLASLKALLYRHTGQERITVGVPVSGRSRLELEPLIGFFVNTLVLQTELTGQLRFRELLSRVREATLSGFAHQDFPFEKLVELIRPDRALGRVPMVEVMLAVEDAANQTCNLPGLTVEFFEVELGAAKFDLTAVFKRGGGRLRLVVEYRSSRFSRSAMGRMAGHWLMLLESVTGDPSQTIGRLPILTPEETAEVVERWNRTRTEYPRGSTIVELFEEEAKQRPDAVAVRYDYLGIGAGGTQTGAVELTYGELNSRSNRVARKLRELGLEAGGRVGLFLDRSPEMVVGMLGILKAGGAYLPLDPAYPAERLGYMVRDSAASIVLAQDQSLFAGDGLRVLRMEEEWLNDGDGSNLRSSVSPEDLAYVIYTSGSTGEPKGVLIPHRAVVRLVCGTDYVQLTRADRVVQVANANFDAATFEVWGPLLNGGMVIGLASEVVFSPKLFAEKLKEHGATTLFLTTALFNQIAREAPEAFAGLRHLLFGGEAVDPKWVRHVLRVGRPDRLLHVYGPTESTTFATWQRVEDVPSDATTVPIGRPIANTRVYLLDEMGQPVPVGVPGEIYIGGDGLALGYLNAPDLNTRRFIPDPFDLSSGAQLYRTGDIARYRDDGTIEFIGRRDHQVKVRGFRIELGEVESILLSHPSVREAVVAAAPEPESKSLRLVAYAVFKEEAAPDARENLSEFLKQKLPKHMLPAALVPLSSLPLTSNGKMDRTRLPAPDFARSAPSSFESPQSDPERRLVRIWEKVLGVKPIGIRDNFFALGGHSLLAVQLFSQIEQEFGARLPLATLFQFPTVAQLANVLATERLTLHQSLFVAIQPSGTRRPFFWIHSLGGDGGGGFFYYRKLAELLGSDQPSFGIRSPEEPFVCIETMAAHYVEQLIQFQLRGPYFLGGFCFGGNVAFEVARQLAGQGREIGLLVLLESAVPNMSKAPPAWTGQAVRLMAEHFRVWWSELIRESPEQIVERVRRKTKSVGRRFTRAMSGRFGRERAELGEVLDMSTYPADYVRYAKAHWRALMSYSPKQYPGRITLFRARKQPLSVMDPTLGWGRYAAGGVAVNVMPGTHEKMLEEPNVHVLATELKACLAEAQVDPTEA